jgi:YVTN family beta-propeller protein
MLAQSPRTPTIEEPLTGRGIRAAGQIALRLGPGAFSPGSDAGKNSFIVARIDPTVDLAFSSGVEVCMMRWLPVLVTASLAVVGSFAATQVALSSLGFPGEKGAAELQSFKGLASSGSIPDPVGGSVAANVTLGMYPVGVGYNNRNGYLYVTSAFSENVSVVNGTTVVATIPVNSGPHTVAYGPYGVAYDRRTGYVYIANDGSDTVTVINGTTIVASVPVGKNPEGVAYNTRNGYIYVANMGSDNVSVINGTTVVATVPVDHGPYGVVYNPMNGYVYVTNAFSNLVSLINGTAYRGYVQVGGGSWGAAYDSRHGYVYVANVGVGMVSVINGTTVVGTVPVYWGPWGVAYDSKNGYVYVTGGASGTVTVINGMTVIGTIPVRSGPVGVAYDDRNGYVYVANGATFYLSVISTALVTFAETGLPAGTLWSVVLDGSSKSSTAPAITFSPLNGPHPYSVASVAGYAASPSSGSLAVNNGAPLNVTISFAPIFLGLPATVGYALLMGIVALVVAVSVVFGLCRAKRKRGIG